MNVRTVIQTYTYKVSSCVIELIYCVLLVTYDWSVFVTLIDVDMSKKSNIFKIFFTFIQHPPIESQHTNDNKQQFRKQIEMIAFADII